MFSGDTLFEGGPGATGRSYSDFPTILESIAGRLGKLPGETVVYTGHGDSTTIGDEIVHYDEWVARGTASELPLRRRTTSGRVTVQTARCGWGDPSRRTSCQDPALLGLELLLGQRAGITQRCQVSELLRCGCRRPSACTGPLTAYKSPTLNVAPLDAAGDGACRFAPRRRSPPSIRAGRRRTGRRTPTPASR